MRVEVRVEGNEIVMTSPDRPMWHYEIPKSHLADESRREEWLSHLEQKRWFTPEVRAAVLAVTA